MAEKDSSRQITVAEMAPHIHHFNHGENKVNKIAEWMSGWIESSLQNGKIKAFDFLPSKDSLAFHIGVSKGTMQNVFRNLEDNGLVESKQRIGTYIKDKKSVSGMEKLTSKREVVCEMLKKHIIKNRLNVGDSLLSTRQLAQELETSNTTLRLAVNYLVSSGVLVKKNNKFILMKSISEYSDAKPETLAHKLSVKLKNYIDKNLRAGDKLPSNSELAKKYGVSIKTIHDTIKILSKEGLIVTRRGKYGSVIVGANDFSEKYFYEKIEQKIKEYIVKNCEIGTKLPTIKEFSSLYKVSTKTIKKALDDLADDGYVRFLRGRYGGTFVVDIPSAGESYTWLAISQEYMPEVDN